MVELIVRQHVEVRASCLGWTGPTLARADAVVAEYADPKTLRFYDRGSARFGEIHAGARSRDPEPPKRGERVLDGLGSGIGDVIAGQSHRGETSVLQGPKVLWVRGPGWNVGRDDAAAR